jgi:succinate dehydrogenase / fumarate reductase cytochrome b subunit
MAYIPDRKPLGSWTRISLAYKRQSGAWAYILHRISGIGLTVYLFVHIFALSGLTKGRAAFQEEMALFTTPPFKFLEWFLGALVMFHAFNGIRIAVVDLGSGAKNNKLLIRLVWGTGITVVLFMFVLIFQEEIFGHPLF